MREYRVIDAWKPRDKSAGNGSISSGGTVAALLLPESPEMSLPHESHVLSLDNEETWENVIISDELTTSQKGKIRALLKEFSDVFSGKPNLTQVIRAESH